MMNRRMVHLWILLLIVGLIALPASVAAWPLAAHAQTTEADVLAPIYGYWPNYSDSFVRDSGLWEIDEESTSSGMVIEEGSYFVAATDPNLFAWGTADASAADLYAEVDARLSAGPVDNEMGIVFRQVDSENFYVFMISSDGYYKLAKLVDSEWADVVSWTESTEIDTAEDALNHFGVYADGPAMSLIVNGIVVATAEDSTFAEGVVALAAGSFDEGGVEIAFDNFAMWDLNALGGQVAVVPPEPTPEGESTPSPSVPMPDLPTTDPDFTEEFRTDTGAWTLENSDAATFSLRNRELTIEVVQTSTVDWSTWNVAYPADFVFQADATQVSGPEGSEYGILFHKQDDDNFYFYAITPQATYSLWKLQADAWTELIPWTDSDAIVAGIGSTNRLGVQTQGALIWLMANDQVIAQYEDDSLAAGAIGLAVGAFDEPNVAVVFDNVDLWVLSEGAAPVATPEPEVTVEATETPVAEVTPEGEETAVAGLLPVSGELATQLETVRELEPMANDEFRRDDGSWNTESDEQATSFYQGRTYHQRIDSPGWATWSTNDELTVSDFVAEIDVAHVAGPENGEQGLVFRFVDAENFYFLAISANGYYTLLKRQNGEWQKLVDWTQAAELNSGPQASNRIGVWAQGDELRLIFNGSLIGQVQDDSFSEGTLGVAAGTFEEGGLEVAFDNLTVWDAAAQ